MAVIKGSSQDAIAGAIESASRAFYGARSQDFNPEKISVSRWYWDEVTRAEVADSTFGMAREMGLKIFDRGFGDELSSHASEFVVAVNVRYKDNLRVKARVFNLSLLRGIIHQDRSRWFTSEYDVWFHKFAAWKSEYNEWRNFVKSRLGC